MAGAATTYFTQKRNQYQQQLEAAQAVQTKVTAANQALEILAQPTISQAQAENLIALHDQAA
jgi:hypothetical protein